LRRFLSSSSSFLLRVVELCGWVWVTRVSFFLFGDSGLVSEGVWVGPFISFSGWVDCWVGVGGFQEFFLGGILDWWERGFGWVIFFFFHDGWVGTGWVGVRGFMRIFYWGLWKVILGFLFSLNIA
jgi:hypothetical protein